MIDQPKIRNVRISLFFILLFSLMAYAVLFSTLILFITNKLKIEDTKASDITSMFLILHFTLQIVGGWLSGIWFSHRFLLSIGLFLQIIGSIFLAFYELNWGLAFFLGGTGFTLVCINSILTQFFLPEDKNREKAFLYNYTAMNLGALIGITISGFFELSHNYDYLFFFAALTDLIALLILLFSWKTLKDQNTFFSLLSQKKRRVYFFLGVGIILLLLLFLRWIAENYYIVDPSVLLLGIAMVAFIVFLALRQREKRVKEKLWAFLIFILTGIVFWTLYLMIPLGIMLFIQNDVQRKLFGITIAPQWTINITTLIVIVGGPFFARYFKKIREKGHKITITTQFITSLIAMALAFICLAASLIFISPIGQISLIYIVVSFILIGIGEVLLSPIGLAMVGQLIAPKFHSIAMGIWFLATAIGAVFANIFSKMATTYTKSENVYYSNQHFFASFSCLAMAALIAALVLLILSKKINRWIEDQ
jgi:proton-dependent oligopeptide transporter, POT family